MMSFKCRKICIIIFCYWSFEFSYADASQNLRRRFGDDEEAQTRLALWKGDNCSKRRIEEVDYATFIIQKRMEEDKLKKLAHDKQLEQDNSNCCQRCFQRVVDLFYRSCIGE